MGNNVYRATDYDILPLNPDVLVSSPPTVAEAHLLGLVRSHLYAGCFLYSYGWDLTRRLQAQWETLQGDAGKALWEVVRPFRYSCPPESKNGVPGGRSVLLEQVSAAGLRSRHRTYSWFQIPPV